MNKTMHAKALPKSSKKLTRTSTIAMLSTVMVWCLVPSSEAKLTSMFGPPMRPEPDGGTMNSKRSCFTFFINDSMKAVTH